MYISKQHSWSI